MVKKPRWRIGLSNEDGRSWTLAQCSEGQPVFLYTFGNSTEGLNAMVALIQTQSKRPRVCIASDGAQTLALLAYLCRIADIEVMLVSGQGYRQYQNSQSIPTAFSAGYDEPKAKLLARCAERMI